MSICLNCRKEEGLDSFPEKLAAWVVIHLFPNTLKDQRGEAHIRGVEEGYLLGIDGRKTADRLKQLIELIEARETPQEQIKRKSKKL